MKQPLNKTCDHVYCNAIGDDGNLSSVVLMVLINALGGK